MTGTIVEIRLNGRITPITAGSTVAALLAEILPERTGAGTAVAVNDEIVRRERYAETTLEAGDRVEVIQAVGGG